MRVWWNWQTRKISLMLPWCNNLIMKKSDSSGLIYINAGMVKLANTLDLGSSGAILAGSSPVTCTTKQQAFRLAALLFSDSMMLLMNLPIHQYHRYQCGF